MPAHRKPNELHVANGTWRGDRHGSKYTAMDSEYLTELPDPPKQLHRYAIQCWNSTGELLIGAKVLTRRDLPMLAHYAELWEMKETARIAVDDRRKQVYAGGISYEDEEINKAMAIITKVMPQITAVLRELGLSPIARSKAAEANQTSKSGGIPRRKRG